MEAVATLSQESAGTDPRAKIELGMYVEMIFNRVPRAKLLFARKALPYTYSFWETLRVGRMKEREDDLDVSKRKFYRLRSKG